MLQGGRDGLVPSPKPFICQAAKCNLLPWLQIALPSPPIKQWYDLMRMEHATNLHVLIRLSIVLCSSEWIKAWYWCLGRVFWTRKMKAMILAAWHGLLLFSNTLGQIKHLSTRIWVFFFFLLPVKWVNDLFAVNPAVPWKIFDEHVYILMNAQKMQEVRKKTERSGDLVNVVDHRYPRRRHWSVARWPHLWFYFWS